MLQQSLASAALGCSLSLTQYAVPLLGLAATRVSTSMLAQQGPREACTAQVSTYHTATRSPRQLAACQRVGPTSWHRYLMCLPSAAAFSSTAQAAGVSSTPSDSANEAAVASASSLESCLELMYELAARQADAEKPQKGGVGAGAGDAAKDWAAYFRKYQMTKDDCWRVVCGGDWENHPKGWTGPARALMQLWRVPGEPEKLDYLVWELDASGLPTGDAYISATALEKHTTRKLNQRVRDSFSVLRREDEPPGPSPGPKSKNTSKHTSSGRGLHLYNKHWPYTRLQTWLAANIGVEQLPRRRPGRGSFSHATVFNPAEGRPK